MNPMISYLHMGGYAGYVWSAYGLSALVMLSLLLSGARSLRQNRRDLKRLKADNQ